MTIFKDSNEVSGLCMTCNHANFCIYLASASSSIWNCEEFDDRPPIIVPKVDIHAAQPELTEETKPPYAEPQLRKAS